MFHGHSNPQFRLFSMLNLAIILSFSLLALPQNLLGAAPSEVKEVDHSREWLGDEYAEVLYSELMLFHPSIKLTMQAPEQYEFKSQLRESFKQIREGWKNSGAYSPGENKPNLQQRLVTTFRLALPQNISDLIFRLEFGADINIAYESVRLENLLSNWVMSRHDNSIAPHEFMIEALRLTKGHVLAAWAIAWNVAKKNWDAAATRNYSQFHRKFISLTGERHLWSGAAHYVVMPENEWQQTEVILTRNGKEEIVTSLKKMKLVITKRGDEFSYLYHRIGVEFFTMMMSTILGSDNIGVLFGSAGALGEYFKYTKTAGLSDENEKRLNNDLQAAQSGERLFELFTGKRKPDPQYKNAKALTYLKSDTLQFDGNYTVDKNTPVQYYNSEGIDRKYFSASMSEDELLLRFQHAVRVDSDIFNPIILFSTGESDRLHRGLSDYLDRGASNAILNGYIQNWLNGDVAKPVVPDVYQDLNLAPSKNLDFAQQADRNYSFEEASHRLKRLMQRVLVSASKRHQPTSVLRISCQGVVEKSTTEKSPLK